MPIIGAYARVELEAEIATRARLDEIEGVSTFDLEADGKVGLLIESSDLDAGHALITRILPQVPGVMGLWPVYVNNEDGLEDSGSLTSGSGGDDRHGG